MSQTPEFWTLAPATARVEVNEIASPNEVPQLIEFLRSPDPTTRRLAIQQIGRIEPTESRAPAVPALIGALGDEEPTIRVAAAGLLGEMRAAKAVPELGALVDDRNAMVRLQAIAALGEIGRASVSAAPRLARLLDASDPKVRSAAAATLGRIGEWTEPATDQMILDLSLPGTYDRVEAARALAAIGPAAADAVPALKEHLADVNCVAASAASALAAIGTSAARDALRAYPHPVGPIPRCE